MSSQIRESEIWAEMARRKVQFHNAVEWDRVKLWGLFSWGGIKEQREKGELFCPGYTRENRTVWCYPSPEAWETKIKPLVDKYTLEELTRMAGWGS